MNDSGCPSPKIIFQYTEGRLENADATELQQHLNSCTACSRLLQDLSAESVPASRDPGDTIALDKSANKSDDGDFQLGSDPTPLDGLTTKRRRKDTPIFAEGQLIGKYRIIKLVGKGGMGQVFQARHAKLDRIVALKTLTQAHVPLPESLERFEREMKAVARLDHPNIVRAFDADETDGVHYFVMEYLEGESVAKILKTSGAMPVAEACLLAQQVAIGLSHIHEHKLIHRDIKPANLIVTPDGTVKILDLGLALLNDNTLDASDLTTSGLVIGTPDFMACEQLEDMRTVDIRADIYSLGATLYALLAGHGPFAGNAYQSTLKKIAAMATKDPPPITKHRDDIPAALETVLEKMLQKEPEDRYQSPDEVITALQPFVDPQQAPLHSRPVKKANRRVTLMATIAAAMMASAAYLFSFGAVTDDAQPLVEQAEGDDTQESLDVPSGDFLPSDSLPKLKNIAAKMADDLLSGTSDKALQSLRAGSDNTLRSYLIQALSERTSNADLILELSNSDQPSCTRSALFLVLSESEVEIDEQQKDALMEVYTKDEDGSVHIAVALLLRRKGFADDVDAANRILQQRLHPSEGWFETLTGHTMVIVPGPTSSFLGSPDSEFGRFTADSLRDETHREIAIDYSFAVSAREVSHAQVHLSQPEYWKEKAPSVPETSFGSCYWNQAAEYCNYLSELEGLPKTEFCYEKVDDDEVFRIKPNAVKLSGYRLPTDEEWEIIARAGGQTARHFGRDTGLFSKYCFGNDTGATHAHERGLLLPNAWGFHDTLGNVSEWIHEAIPNGPRGLAYRLRGGSCWTDVSGIRAAARYYIEWNNVKNRYGLRIARTIHPHKSRSDQYKILAGSVTGDDRHPVSTDAQFTELSPNGLVCLGTWQRSEDPSVRTIRFRNTSAETVTVSTERVRGKFEFIESRTVDIDPQSHADFGLRVTIDGSGPQAGKARLHVTSTSGMETVVIRLCGKVHGAVCKLFEADVDTQPPEFSFGDLPVNSTLQHRFTIHNPGDEWLLISKAEVSEGFTIVDSPKQIPLSGYGTIVVRADAVTAARHQGYLEIHSNDGAQTIVKLNLLSNVVQQPVSSLGIYRRGVWLFDHNHDGAADEEIMFGGPDSHPVTGDWNGDGICDLAVLDPAANGKAEWQFHLRGTDAQMGNIICGPSDCTPLSSNFLQGDRDDPVAVFPGANNDLNWTVYSNGEAIRQAKTTARPGSVCVGDWDGDLRDDIVSVFSQNGKYRWKVECAEATHQLNSFGAADDFPVFGDWDGDGKCEPGVVRINSQGQAEWLFDISRTGDLPERELTFGQKDDHPLVLSASATQTNDKN